MSTKDRTKNCATPKQNKWRDPFFAHACIRRGTQVPDRWRRVYRSKVGMFAKIFGAIKRFVAWIKNKDKKPVSKKFAKKLRSNPSLVYHPAPVKKQLHVRMRRGTR